MPEVCRTLGIAEQTYYRWRKEYGGLKVGQAGVVLQGLELGLGEGVVVGHLRAAQ